jgi:hypothetical protein
VQDVYPNLVVNDEEALGLDVDVVKVVDFPGPKGDPINILLDLPSEKEIIPDNFADGYIPSYKKYFKYMKKHYTNKKFPYVLNDLNEFDKIFPNTDDVHDWVFKNPKDFYVPFRKYFYDFEARLTLGILPFRFMDKRTLADKDILEGYKSRLDIDTLQRSSVIVNNGVRNYHLVKRTGDEKMKQKGMASLAISKASQKYSKVIGVKYNDMSENAHFVVDSIFEQADKKGKIVPHFRTSKVDEDCSGNR